MDSLDIGPIDLSSDTDAEVLSVDDINPTIPASVGLTPEVIDLTQDNDRGTEQVDSAEVRQYVHTYLLILHAHKCRQSEATYRCTIRGCNRTKSVLSHMATCSNLLSCPLDGCRDFRQAIGHWKNCSDLTCDRCAQLRLKLQDLSTRKQQEAQAVSRDTVTPQQQQDSQIQSHTNDSPQIFTSTRDFGRIQSHNYQQSYSAPTEVHTNSLQVPESQSRQSSAFTPVLPHQSTANTNITDIPRASQNFNIGINRNDQHSEMSRQVGPSMRLPTVNTGNQTLQPRDLSLGSRDCQSMSSNSQSMSSNSQSMSSNSTCLLNTSLHDGQIQWQNSNPAPSSVMDLSRSAAVPTMNNQAGLERVGQDPGLNISDLSTRLSSPDVRLTNYSDRGTDNSSTRHGGQSASSLDQFQRENPHGSTDEQTPSNYVSHGGGLYQSIIPNMARHNRLVSRIESRASRLQGGAQTPRWCRSPYEIRVHLTCLRSPNTTSSRGVDMDQLGRYGLGVAFNEDSGRRRGESVVMVDHDRAEIDDYLRDVFPALRHTSFHLCATRRSQGRLVRLSSDCRSGVELREHFLSMNCRSTPFIYIRPDVYLTDADLEQSMGGPFPRLQHDSDDLPDDLDQDSADGSEYSERIVRVRRSHIVKDMLKAFSKDAIRHSHVRINLEGENAEDAGGVFRDILSEFWATFMDSFFEGENQLVPRVNSEMDAGSWSAAGRILYRGYKQEKYLPIKFCMASLAYAMLGTSDALEVTLLDSFLEYLPAEERSVLKKSLMISHFPAGYSSSLEDELIDIMSKFGMRSVPNPDNVRQLALRSAEIALFERPYFPLHQMNLGRMKELSDFSVLSIELMYKRMRPDGTKVSELLFTNSESSVHIRTLGYLKHAVESFSEDLVKRFLRFVTGSDVMAGRNIEVNFVHVAGLERRFVAHTCGPSLEAPDTYDSYEEFLSELQTQLLSDYWEMNFI